MSSTIRGRVPLRHGSGGLRKIYVSCAEKQLREKVCEGRDEGELGGICAYHTGKKLCYKEAVSGSEI